MNENQNIVNFEAHEISKKQTVQKTMQFKKANNQSNQFQKMQNKNQKHQKIRKNKKQND